MFLRLLVILIVIAIIYFLAKNIGVLIAATNHCRSCDGKGYWRGTRGESNPCKDCNGTGAKRRK